ncbi:MAG: D-tyrosyl-tRNA(Tyr) deacylase [Synergistaceae bacterium]|nr:D-tyrosyl-tRNA(Tyr) deacylase [Synergistaceae bacterium]MBP9560067.1 D-tyrosyl-tRNA(Tyr) deacylase [Synergistaceae bacterium]MBP9975755.1 D-tyrosyl-tRNA(Tyr) deacylase [Synergistaceae bacterium]MDD2351895.1 D-aminoacyl-tRNA deacylase [Synergistaceae bacterium]PKL04630.1 MAG: D-tyrosyl-tRNA(Tyr) deacylase [Synergistetes bacterium HGW-Synergistetes-1]
MKALLQRVDKAGVSVEGKLTGEIGKGLCVFLGVVHEDTEKDITWLADKIVNLRIFEDGSGKMNRSVIDEKGEILVVSQFTLCGDCKKGRRPSWTNAAEPSFANSMYEKFVKEIEVRGVRTATGVFQAYMKVEICNDGPVTLMIDTRE